MELYFLFNISIISSYVNWNLYTRSSRSLYFTFFNSSSISFFWVLKSDKLFSLSPIFTWFLFSLTIFRCDSIPFWDKSYNNFFSSLKVFSADLICQWPGTVIENELFSSIISKNKLVASKVVTATIHLSPSTNFIGRLKENVCVCFLILNSSVSCYFALNCSISVSACFLNKKIKSLFIIQKF